MSRIARLFVVVALIVLVISCASHQYATGYPKDELVLSRLGNTVAVLYNGEVVQKVEVRSDFRFDGTVPIKSTFCSGNAARFLVGEQFIFSIMAATVRKVESMCDTVNNVKCFSFDYMGIEIPCSIDFYGDGARVDFTIIQSDKHMLTLLYYEKNSTPAKDSPEFDSFCNGLLARALATFKVDLPALRQHMTPAKPEA